MKKKLLLLLLILCLVQGAFATWRVGINDKGDAFYYNGTKEGTYDDEFVMFFFDEYDFHNGYLVFGGSGQMEEDVFLSTVTFKGSRGDSETFKLSTEIISNPYYHSFRVDIDTDTVRKLVPMFRRNSYVEISVKYGSLFKAKSINYGKVDCSDFAKDNSALKGKLCSAVGHSYTESIEKTATCAEEGLKKYTCKNCGYSYTKSIPRTEHNFVSDGFVKEADCENFGIQKLKCSTCGEEKKEAVKALGHSWDSGTVTKEMTCTEDGVKVRKCGRCGKIRTEVIRAGHRWEIKTGEYAALTCRVCGLKETQYGLKGPAGGYIFYDCDADNASGNADGLKSSECGWRYLEAAPENLSEECVWGDDGKFWTKFGTKTGIGEGRNNTNIIVNHASNIRKNNAAMACVVYDKGGYSDWFLPSLYELYLMYENLKSKRRRPEGYSKDLNYLSEEIDLEDTYWSSTESSIGSDDEQQRKAYIFFINDRKDVLRDDAHKVRPIRAFI